MREAQEEKESEHVEMEGVVESSTKGILKVALDAGQIVTCHLSGKIRKNKINIVPGDRVRVKLSPYDLARGIIARRL
jgi:translation initiation factor IF-1